MSNSYKIGTRGLTPYDNNYLVWDADVRRLYIDKDTPVDIVSITNTLYTPIKSSTTSFYLHCDAWTTCNDELFEWDEEDQNWDYVSDIWVYPEEFDANGVLVRFRLSSAMHGGEGSYFDCTYIGDNKYSGTNEYGADTVVTLYGNIEYSTDRVPSLACLEEATRGGRNLFDIFYSMSSKTPQGAMDLSLGTLISSADTALPDFYNECVSRASAGAIPTCTETAWQSEVSTYGSCAKFVVNTTDKSIRLPKITNYLRAGSDSELGTVLNDQFQGHRHYGQSSTVISGSGSNTGSTGLKRTFYAETDGTIEGDNGVPRVGSETRPKTSYAKLYIQVYTSATEASMAQAAEFINSLEAIYTKIAGQFSETTTSAGTTGTGANDTVVEYWKSADGTMWYRLWASGWVEQGGFIDRTVSASTTVTVSLPVEFSDGDYTILRSLGSTGTGTASWRGVSTTARTTTTFNIYVGSASDSANATWYACGWSA